MAVSIILDRPYAHFTNLDFITGKVILTLSSHETISVIVVKLEGESISRVEQPNEQGIGQRGKSFGESEVHKVSEYLILSKGARTPCT
jgi:hypothetical protein